MSYPKTLRTYEQLNEGDLIEVIHEVKVGFRDWRTRTAGTVVRKQRQRHGLHYRRGDDEPALSDTIILRRTDGELTTVTLDEFTEINVLRP